MVGAFVAAAGLLPAAEAAAQRDGEDAPVELHRLDGPIELDGVPNEEAWAAVPALPLTMYFPTHRGTPAERTEIRVAYDDEHLYAAGWFYDSDPEGIRINSLYRDRWNGDDAFAIYVDAFNDNENAKWFGTTPGGIRFDLLVSDDGATLNGSWDAFWETATRVEGNGWFAEVRIPFSTLGFQADEEGRAVMGLTVTRLVSRTGERVTFPDIDPAFPFRQPSKAQDVLLRDVRSPNPVRVTAYALSAAERRAVPEPGGFGAERETTAEAGLDVRYPLSSNLTLDLTVNTDFAQVEADEQQVNQDRFSLFFPEKRRFFQERSGIFDFQTGQRTRLFHSRRIGLTPDRRPLPVLGGARLVGRVGEWDVGLLDMHTGEGAGIPGENFGVARVRRRVLNDYSTVGALLTTRTGGVRDNVALGVDGTFRLFGSTYLSLKAAGSADSRDPENSSLWERSHLFARWTRRASRGLAYDLQLTRSNADFEPGVGFLPRRDFTEANALANWYVFTDDHPLFRRIWPGALAFSTFRNGDGELESGQYAVWLQWETKAGTQGWIEPKLFVDDVLRPFSIGSDVGIPAGRYTYADLQLVLRMPTGRRLRTTLDARAGTFFDGTRWQLVLGPTWNASPHLELGANYQWTRLRFEGRGQATDIHLARLRVRTALDARASGNAFVQYNGVTDRLDLNVRLRYNFAEGNDLWLVFNEGMNTDRLGEPGTPELPLSDSRSLILKYTYTFGF